MSTSSPLDASESPTLSAPPRIRPRVWPGVVMIALMWLLIRLPYMLPDVPGEYLMTLFMAPLVPMAGLLLWWVFASRIPWWQRGVILAAFAGAAVGASYNYHPTLGGMTVMMYPLPVALTAWVAWLLVTPFLAWPARAVSLVCVFVLTWGFFALLRIDGMDGSFEPKFAWRWQEKSEDKYLAELKARGQSKAEGPVLRGASWSAFRGPERDGRCPDVRINTDWEKHPPKLLWKQRIGPGWSSFAVVGNAVFTQEQRGAVEAVVCYNADTGAEFWAHGDDVRFEETVSEAGPRATPTFHDGKVYSLGAKGTLNCLDAATGQRVWSRDVAADSGAKVPEWGFSSSPLVAKGLVSVFAGGADGKAVLAYDAEKGGDPVWTAAAGLFSYSSPQLCRFGDEDQILVVTGAGVTGLEPLTGKVVWQHDWPVAEGMARVVQPSRVGESDILLGMGMGIGTRRVHVAKESDEWTSKEVWTTRQIKPYFNDMVVHKGHVYGFDANFLVCVDLATGKSKWRGRGYDNGQVLLLPDQDLLLIVTEKTGEVALVEAKPGEHKELGRFQAFEGKTWNHPVVADGKLFVRNNEWVACYRLEPADK